MSRSGENRYPDCCCSRLYSDCQSLLHPLFPLRSRHPLTTSFVCWHHPLLVVGLQCHWNERIGGHGPVVVVVEGVGDAVIVEVVGAAVAYGRRLLCGLESNRLGPFLF